jgi:hypothetical protein
MSETLESYIVFLSVALILLGFILIVVALKFRTSKSHSLLSFNPKHWIPLWKMREAFRPPGYTLNLVGWLLVLVGCAISVVKYLLF